jgi:hypothetical protein
MERGCEKNEIQGPAAPNHMKDKVGRRIMTAFQNTWAAEGTSFPIRAAPRLLTVVAATS